jgi:hypothetical protein
MAKELPNALAVAKGEKIAASGMNLTFDTRSMSALKSNVKFENSTTIISLLVVLLFPTFALAVDTNGTQMLETNH